MARTLADVETHAEPSPPQAASRREAILADRVPTAFRLTDQQGRRAFVWWEDKAVAPVVDADDPAFRRRILRALKKPIWSTEDIPDEHGFSVTTRVLLQPDDPRYPSRLFFRWDQICLGDLAEVDVVTRQERQPVETLLSLLAAASRA
jgi:hypothetical protein